MGLGFSVLGFGLRVQGCLVLGFGFHGSFCLQDSVVHGLCLLGF